MTTAGRAEPPTIQRELLAAAGAQRGHFRYESGHHGDLWLDLDTLFVNARRMARWAIALSRQAAPIEPDVVCGPLTGGAFLAQLVAADLGAGFAFAGRYVSPGSTVHYALPSALGSTVRGRRVLVADDAINAGSAVSATLEALFDAGAVPAGIACLLALGPAGPEIARRYAIPFFRLAAVERGIWLPERCPLCAAAVPLVRERGG